MKEFKFEILQINNAESNLLFCSLPEGMEKINLKEQGYETIYKACLKSEDEDALLEDLYYIFNMQHPKDYKGRSLSMSDIIKVNDDKCYYCNSFGWSEVKCS